MWKRLRVRCDRQQTRTPYTRETHARRGEGLKVDGMRRSRVVAFISPFCSSNHRPILQRRGFWRESALEARPKTGMSTFAIRAQTRAGSVSGGIRQMGADRVQLDPVTSRMFRTAPYGLMASPRLIGCILAGYMRSKEKDGGD